MCGIIGYVGDDQAAPILLEGLARLEYRGYDSAGIAVLDGDRLSLEKRAGKLGILASAVDGRCRTSARGSDEFRQRQGRLNMLRLPEFRYVAARSMDEAATLLAEHAPQAMVVAGGTDLYPLACQGPEAHTFQQDKEAPFRAPLLFCAAAGAVANSYLLWRVAATRVGAVVLLVSARASSRVSSLTVTPFSFPIFAAYSFVRFS